LVASENKQNGAQKPALTRLQCLEQVLDVANVMHIRMQRTGMKRWRRSFWKVTLTVMTSGVQV
jgi:hypothetical protein